MKQVYVLLFDDFETLDAFGPAEILGRLPEEYELRYISFEGDIKTSSQGVPVRTESAENAAPGNILLLPGGMGTRPLVEDGAFLDGLKKLAAEATYVLTVCTGSALLAKTGLLDEMAATSNKIAWDWVTALNPAVRWQPSARWVVADKFYTASGVSAGMDMALGFVADRLGRARAEAVAREIEYRWHPDAADDPFAVEINK